MQLPVDHPISAAETGCLIGCIQTTHSSVGLIFQLTETPGCVDEDRGPREMPQALYPVSETGKLL